MSKKPELLAPDDFPVHADACDLKTTRGENVGAGKTPQITEQIADKLNEQANREEEDRWSA
jgi:hypothetical protein